MNLWPWQWSKAETSIHRQYLNDLEARHNGTDVQEIKDKEVASIEHVSLEHWFVRFKC